MLKSIWRIGSKSIETINLVTILFGIIMLSFIWGGLFMKVQSERQLDINDAMQDTANYAHTFAEHTARTIRGLDEVVKALKYQAEKEGLALDLPGLVQSKRFEGQPFVALAILNETGDLVASSNIPAGPTSAKDRDAFRVHQLEDSGALYIEKPMPGRIVEKMAIHLSRRINKADGSFGGVAVVAVDPYYFAEFYKQIHLGDQSNIALIGLDGILRVRQSGDDIKMGLDFSQALVMKLVTESKTGSFLSTGFLDSFTRINSYRVMADYPLIVVVGVAEEYILRNFNARVTTYYWVCTLVSIVIVGFVWMLLASIRQRKQAEERLAEQGAFLGNLVTALPIPVYYKDCEGRFLGVNKAFEVLHGVTNQEMIGKTGSYIVPPELDEKFQEKDQAVLRGQGVQIYESWLPDASGTRRNVVFHKAAFTDTHGAIRGVIGAILDVTERKELEKKLLVEATTDGLTGLLNRRHFLQRCAEELERMERYGGSAVMLVFDIDHFKKVNDSFGHAAGDSALQHLAAVCRQTLRDSDLLGRIGGEEFTAFLVECNLDSGLDVAERLRRTVEDMVTLAADGTQIQFTISIGAVKTHRGDTVMALLAEADKAMYQAKQKGRNRVVAAGRKKA